MDVVWWILAVVLIVVGVAGTVLPGLPGMPLIFAGAWVAAAIGGYAQIGTATLVVLGVLAAIGIAVDWVASALGAQRAGATRAGLIGAAVGTLAGLFTGLWGLIFMPWWALPWASSSGTVTCCGRARSGWPPGSACWRER